MIKVILNNYKSYLNTHSNERESHIARLLFFAFTSLIVAISVTSPVSSMTTLMVTGLAILTGFTFTALFSDHSLAEAGLPPPTSESDRLEITRLTKLSENFRVRSDYFITMSVLNVALLILVGTGADPSIPAKWIVSVTGLSQHTFIDTIGFLYTVFSQILFVALIFVCTLIFLENLYTFYRLTETTLAILNARRSYFANSKSQQSKNRGGPPEE